MKQAPRVSLVAVALAAVLAFVGLAGAPSSAIATAVGPQWSHTAPTQSVWSEYVTITVTGTVPKGAPKPAGALLLVDDEDSAVAETTLSNGVARFRTKALPVGTNVLTVVDETDTDLATPTITVVPAQTVTTLVSKKADVATGATAWFQAAVAAVAPATTVPTGSVAFTLDGATTPAATVPASAGVAAWRPRLADGPHSVSATFVPASDDHAASTSSAVAQRVGPPAPAGQLDQSAPMGGTFRHISIGSGQTFTAGVTGLLTAVKVDPWQTFSSSVEIYALADGVPTGQPLGARAVAPLGASTDLLTLDTPVPVVAGTSYALTLTSPSTKGFRASSTDPYAGGVALWNHGGGWATLPTVDLGFETYVVPAPTVTSSLTTSTAQAVWSQYVDLTATITPPAGGAPATGTVTFSAGQTELGSATIVGGKAKLRTKALPLGEHEITAVGPNGPITGSPTITVVPAFTTTTLVSRKTDVATGDTAWFQAKVVADAPATTTPTGSIVFYLDFSGTPAATVPLSAGVASFRPRLADGVRTVTAIFFPDPTHLGSSAEAEQRVGPPPPVSVIDQSNTTGGDVTTVGYEQGAGGQTFVAGRTGNLDRVELDFPTAGQAYTLAIWRWDGDNAIHQQSGITEEGLTSVPLTGPAPVEAGVEYVIFLSPVDGQLDLVSSDDDPYPVGRFLFVVQPVPAGRDLVFATYVTEG